jgi:hypothetical protein
MVSTEYVDLAHVVDCCRFSAQKDWRDDHARGTRLQDLFADHIARLETTVTERPGGRAEVLVRVTARKPHQSEAFFYKFQMIAGGWTQLDGV